MSDGARVTLTDNRGQHHGTVMKHHTDGLCVVKWDNDVAERVHESELTLEREEHDVVHEGHESDDPKSHGWRERLASLWDSRPGK